MAGSLDPDVEDAVRWDELADDDVKNKNTADDTQPSRLYPVTCTPAPLTLRRLKRARSRFRYHGYPVTLNVPASNDARAQSVLAHVGDAAAEWGQPYWLEPEDEEQPDMGPCATCSVQVRCDLGQVVSSRISFKCAVTVDAGGTYPLYEEFGGTLLSCESGVKRVAICPRGSACRRRVDELLSKRDLFPWVPSSSCSPQARFHDDAWLDASGRLNVSLTGYHSHMAPSDAVLALGVEPQEFETRVPRWRSRAMEPASVLPIDDPEPTLEEELQTFSSSLSVAQLNAFFAAMLKDLRAKDMTAFCSKFDEGVLLNGELVDAKQACEWVSSHGARAVVRDLEKLVRKTERVFVRRGKVAGPVGAVWVGCDDSDPCRLRVYTLNTHP
ncbi:MAG: hypothetical protein R3B07_28510 [Polyangiaceae bacterium]